MVTSHCPSEEAVTSTPKLPLYGLGQGTTDALSNWALISSPCQKAYAKNCRGCTLKIQLLQ
eukprot:76017-Ditylum_brightwellii.AAC.1